MKRGGYEYILTNKDRTVLYVGVTSNLSSRVYDHQNGTGSNFTAKYNCKDLIYYESFLNIEEAIHREKLLKKWNREWKFNLIKKENREMNRLNEEVFEKRI